MLLGPGIVRPADACSQPLGTARDLIRAGNVDRAALIKQRTSPCDTARKLRAGEGGVRLSESTPDRSFDSRRAARAAPALLTAEARSDEEDVEDTSPRGDTWRVKPREEWYRLAMKRRDEMMVLNSELAEQKKSYARGQVSLIRDVVSKKLPVFVASGIIDYVLSRKFPVIFAIEITDHVLST